MDDVVFKLTTVYDGSQLAEGMGASTATIETDTTAWREAFVSVNTQIQNSTEAMIAQLRLMTSEINQIPVATRQAAVESGGALDYLQEKFVQTAEVSKLSAAGVGSAFGGLSALLGGGLLLGLMAHFLDETNKEVLELGHLAEKTGIAIEALSGLQLVTREMGVNFDTVTTSMVRLERAQSLAVEGGKMQEQAFQRIGLTVKDIEGLNPEQLFNTVSGAIQKTGSSADVANSSIALLGRGGAAMIPIFKQYGDRLGDVIDKTGETTGVTEQAYQEALKWQKITAELSAELRKLGIEVIGGLMESLRGLHALWIDSRFAVEEFGVSIKQFALDAATAANPFTNWADKMQSFTDHAHEAAGALAELKSQHADAVGESKGGGGSETFDQFRPTGDNTPSGEGAPGEKRLLAWKLDLQRLQDATDESHSVMVSQELAFWETILRTQKLSGSEELEIRHTVATLSKQLTNEGRQEVMRGFEEEAHAADAGSKQQMEALQLLYDFSVKTYGPMSAEATRAYEQIAAAAKAAAKEQQKIVEEVARAHERANEQIVVSAAKLAETQNKAQGSGAIAAIKAQADLGIISKKQEEQALEQVNKDELKNLQDTYAAERTELEKHVQLTKQAAAAAVGTHDEAAAIEAETQAQTKLNSVTGQFVQEQERLRNSILQTETTLAKLESSWTTYFQKMKAETQDLSTTIRTTLQASIDQLEKGFAQNIAKMAVEGQNLGDSMRKLAANILETMISMLTQWLVHWVLAHTVMKLLGKQEETDQIVQLGAQTAAVRAALAAQAVSYQANAAQFILIQTQETAAVQANQAAQTAAHVIADTAQIAANAAVAESDIGLAAAMVFLQAIEGVAFPANLVAAPAAAQAMWSAGQPYAIAAAAADGYDVPGGSGVYPTILHPREMVLPADLAGGVRQMTRSTSTSSSSSSPTTVHANYSPTFNGPVDTEKDKRDFVNISISKLRRLGVATT